MRHSFLLEIEDSGAFICRAVQTGDTNSDVVEVRFVRPVFSLGGDYALGVTIEVNGTPAAISSSARQSDTAIVHYTISASSDADDVVTWAYTGGDLEDAVDNSKTLGSVAAMTAANLIGTHFWFNNLEDSGHAMLTMRL